MTDPICQHLSWENHVPGCGRCADCGYHLSKEEVANLVGNHDEAEAVNVVPVRMNAVVYALADGKVHEVYAPVDAAVAATTGGILVQHESAEVDRILSIRPVR